MDYSSLTAVHPYIIHLNDQSIEKLLFQDFMSIHESFHSSAAMYNFFCLSSRIKNYNFKIKKLENLNKIETVNSECCHLIQLYNFNIKYFFIWGIVLFLRDLVFVSNTVLRGLKSFYNLMRKENILKLTVFEHIRNMEVILCRSFYVHLLIAGIIQIKST